VSGIELAQATKDYAGNVRAVDAVTLSVESGEFVVLVGPSGCGKSTLLRMIAGLEDVTAGRVFINGSDVTDLPPRARDVAMVFQNYALYPHMTVRQNLGYGLKVRREPKARIAERVDEVAAMLGLQEYMDRRPAALSGGQRQRVAMGRAIARRPACYLMDEPLSNLDAKLRASMRAEVGRLHEELGVTTVYVTHDQVEAMTLGERVAVMRRGRVQQYDRPPVLYAAPANLFVASFIGSPSMNLIDAQIGGGRVSFCGFEIPLDAKQRPAIEGAVVLGVRPEHVADAEFGSGDRPIIEVDVAVVEHLGHESHVLFLVDGSPVDADEIRDASEGEQPGPVLARDQRRAVLIARVDARTRARAGQTVRLALDPGRFYFFDKASGERLPAVQAKASALL
jgi:multiple sugar transport system ATP-binding protein